MHTHPDAPESEGGCSYGPEREWPARPSLSAKANPEKIHGRTAAIAADKVDLSPARQAGTNEGLFYDSSAPEAPEPRYEAVNRRLFEVVNSDALLTGRAARETPRLLPAGRGARGEAIGVSYRSSSRNAVNRALGPSQKRNKKRRAHAFAQRRPGRMQMAATCAPRARSAVGNGAELIGPLPGRGSADEA
ncbi:hypothetical protein MRX96_007537 [Rhipicephalus microplus]